MWGGLSTVLAVLFPCINAACMEKTNYERIIKLEGRGADASTAVLDTILGFDIPSCAGECNSKTNCRCLRLQNEECTLYEFCPQPAGNLDGAVYYTVSGLAGHRGSCADDLVCGFEGAICYLGQCLCQIGLFFSPSRNRCLRECDELSSDITVYEGKAILENNEKILLDLSPVECQTKCIQETSFTCLSIDHKAGENKCYLQVVAFLDVPLSHRTQNSDDLSYGQRNCI